MQSYKLQRVAKIINLFSTNNTTYDSLQNNIASLTSKAPKVHNFRTRQINSPLHMANNNEPTEQANTEMAQKMTTLFLKHVP
jgi:hypothetical protein